MSTRVLLNRAALQSLKTYVDSALAEYADLSVEVDSTTLLVQIEGFAPSAIAVTSES